MLSLLRTTLHNLSLGGWVANFIVGVALLLGGPWVGDYMSNPKGKIIGFAAGLTILIWVVALQMIQTSSTHTEKKTSDEAILHQTLQANDKKVSEVNVPTNDTGRTGQEQLTSSPINVTGNTGNTQISIHSPGSQQIINQKRVMRKDCRYEKLRRNDLSVLRVMFQQTTGIWDPGEKFMLEVELSGPYKNWHFLGGFPSVLNDYVEVREERLLKVETTTSPLNEPIILEIEAESEIDIKQIRMHPVEG